MTTRVGDGEVMQPDYAAQCLVAVDSLAAADTTALYRR